MTPASHALRWSIPLSLILRVGCQQKGKGIEGEWFVRTIQGEVASIRFDDRGRAVLTKPSEKVVVEGTYEFNPGDRSVKVSVSTLGTPAPLEGYLMDDET